MKISLGQHETVTGKIVTAWIEPNYPAYRSGAVRDNGFLCVEESNPDPADKKPIKLRLESMSEEGWKLQSAVGTALMRQLWNERREYDRSPYYMVLHAAQREAVYFEPWVAIGSEPSVAFHTRPDGRYPKESTVLPEDKASEQLQALFTHERLQLLAGLTPDTDQIADAIDHGRRMANAVMAARAEYAALVDWEFDNRLTKLITASTGRTPLTTPEDIERYDQLSSWAERPDRYSFETDSAEFYRWFEYGGKARLEPLTSEQLTSYLRDKRHYPADQAERTGQRESVSSADWEWFKDKRLGRMREPVEVLHHLIEHEAQRATPNREWIEKATKAGDYCATVPVSPAKVHAAIQEYVAQSQRDYVLAHTREDREATQRELAALANDPVYRTAAATVTMMQDPESGLVVEQEHPVSKVLGMYEELHENNLARIAALSHGDKEAAAHHANHYEALTAKYHRIEAEMGRPTYPVPDVTTEAERDDDNDMSP